MAMISSSNWNMAAFCCHQLGTCLCALYLYL